MTTSLFTAVSGLAAHQEMLNVVGNNLANTNTTGYKSQRVRFADLVYQTLNPATTTVSDALGGTNPVQRGNGVRVAAIDTNLGQGTLQATGNDFDMALQGDGFFVLSDGFKTVFTRAGQFGIDREGYLTDLSTGLRVQRFGDVGEPSATSPGFQTPNDHRTKISLDATTPGRATSQIDLQGNLDAFAPGPVAQELTAAQPLLTGGAAATGATPLNGLDSNGTDYAAGDQLRLQGIAADGSQVDVAVAVPADVAGLLAAINANFPGSTASLAADGRIVLQSDTPGPSALSLTISDAAGNTGSTAWSQHGLAVTAEGTDAQTVSTAIPVVDVQGRSHTLSLVFTKVADNEWTLSGSIPAAEGAVTSGTIAGIQFNENGSFQQAGGGSALSMTFQFNGLVTPQTITFDFGSANGFNGLTQVGGTSSAAAVRQDGFVAGSLSDVSIGSDGVVNGIFSNGRILPMAQIAVARFANPAALTREGNNYLSQSAQSGEPLIGGAASGGRGTIQQGSLENSNVDVALEFTRLIVAQRGFQVNARAITVSDDVLQELANIIR